MLTVVIESPYAHETPGGVQRHLQYGRACMAYCLANDAAPYASHALYTQPGVLDDKIPEQRKNGMRAGNSIAKKLDERWVFIDLGITDGMLQGEAVAKKNGQPTRRISLPDWEKNPAREALVDRVRSSLLHREGRAPSRDLVAAWTDEDLEQVTVWLNVPEDYTKQIPECIVTWARSLKP